MGRLQKLEVNHCYGYVARDFGYFRIEYGIRRRTRVLFTFVYELERIRSSKYATSKSHVRAESLFMFVLT